MRDPRVRTLHPQTAPWGTNIQYMASRQDLRVLMITGSMGGEGKSTTSSNLAVVLAQAGKRGILISADLRRPRIHLLFGLRNEAGLSNVLSDGLSLAQVARDPGIPNLRVISGGFIPQDPAALLRSPRAARFVESLPDVADFILIDTPPVLALADASILVPMVDGTLFVLDAQGSRRSAMQQSRDQLENAGGQHPGRHLQQLRGPASTPHIRTRSATTTSTTGPRRRRRRAVRGWACG